MALIGGKNVSADSDYDPLEYDILGNRLSEEEIRWRADPNHWFNDQEDNRYWEQYDRELMAGMHRGEAWEAARRMEEAGQTTVTINGREYPAATTADLERMYEAAQERERQRAQTESPS